MLFVHKFNSKVFPYFLSNEGILPTTHNMQEMFSCHRKRHFCTASSFSLHRKKFLVTERNLLSWTEIYCHRKKLLCIRRFFCHIKQLLVTGRNFMSQLEFSCQNKKFLFSDRNFLSQEEISVTGKSFIGIKTGNGTVRETKQTICSNKAKS